MPVNLFKDDPVTNEFENLAKNTLKGELKRRGITYADLAERLKKIGVSETERNLNNKISRGVFSALCINRTRPEVGRDVGTIPSLPYCHHHRVGADLRRPQAYPC
jgi:hypothetical protein